MSTDTNFAERCVRNTFIKESNPFVRRVSASAAATPPGCEERAGAAAMEQHPPKSHRGERLSQGGRRSIPTVFTWLERCRRTFIPPSSPGSHHPGCAGWCLSPQGTRGWVAVFCCPTAAQTPEYLGSPLDVAASRGDVCGEPHQRRWLVGAGPPPGPPAQLRNISSPLDVRNGVNPSYHSFGTTAW